MDIISWQDHEGFVHVNKNPDVMDSENGVLFTAYACSLGMLKYTHKPINLFSLYNQNGWKGSAFGTGDHFSHDNYLGMLYLQKKFNMGFKGTYLFDFIEYGHWHPRDIILFNYIRGHKWLFPFLIIPIIACVISCLESKEKGTSGQLLARLRCRAAGLHLTEKLCNYLVKKEFGSWHEVFTIYFKNKGHPCRVLSESL